jgi:hypothetical protein
MKQYGEGAHMTAPVTAMSESVVGPDIWNRFRTELEQQVRECNTVSGEMLWDVSNSSGAFHVTVHAVTSPGQRLDCSMSNGVLSAMCTRGPGTPARLYQFRCIAGPRGVFLDGTPQITVSEALRLILDQLNWPDE